MYQKKWYDFEYYIPLDFIYVWMFLLASCLGQMRWIDVVWMDLISLWYDVEYYEEWMGFTAVSCPIVQIFKLQHGFLGCYLITIAGTNQSGIQFLIWMKWFINRISHWKELQKGGPLGGPSQSKTLAGRHIYQVNWTWVQCLGWLWGWISGKVLSNEPWDK